MACLSQQAVQQNCNFQRDTCKSGEYIQGIMSSDFIHTRSITYSVTFRLKRTVH